MNRWLTLLFWMLLGSGALFGQQVDFSKAAIWSPAPSEKRVDHYVKLLQEEVEIRTKLQWPLINAIESNEGTTIVLLYQKDLSNLASEYQNHLSNLPSLPNEGFFVSWMPERQTLLVVGKDDRGLLYGIGRILRKMQWEEGKVKLPLKAIEGGSAPKYPIRGHQLGYRPKTNSYDAFTVSRFEQYIRELAIFGANSIEIVPPRTDDDFTSRHMVLPAIEMIAEQSRIADELDLDVWMWYPNMGEDYTHPDSIANELEERHEVFGSVSRLDHLFVPGGDPGELAPDELFAWLEKTVEVLHQYHPEAKVWVSPQVFRPTKEWFDRFFYHINQRYSWLGGVVFGPWVKIPLPELRELVDKSIPIRRYPDITHSLSAQYPVPEWDLAMAMTLGRECINPRPGDQKVIHNALDQFADGSLSYSEGTNDDVNKFIWTDQDWDPDTPVIETLRDYARFFFGPDWVEGVAQGFLAQEENLRGPLITNTQVPLTLQQWQNLEDLAGEDLLGNFRFQMGLIRAYFDAYVQRKLIFQTEMEAKAKVKLQKAAKEKVDESITSAIELLEQSINTPLAERLKNRCLELAEELYQSIGAQLTIHPHGAAPGRGNFIDNLDAVLNDAPWLLDKLRAIPVEDSAQRVELVRELIHRNNPGPGGFYDDFGQPKSWKRVVFDKQWAEDPGSLYSPRISFGVGLIGVEWVHEVRAVGFEGAAAPRSWMMQVNTLYDTPLRIKYDQLNPDLAYTLKVAYTGRFRSRMKLEVENGQLIHDFIQTGHQPIYEFKLPKDAYSQGEITFNWTCGEGERGAQVAEIWLIPEVDP
jgi:hypothetical protein